MRRVLRYVLQGEGPCEESDERDGQMSRNLYQVRIIEQDGSAMVYGGNVLFTTIKKASLPMRAAGMRPIVRSHDGRKSVREYYDTVTRRTWRIVDNDFAFESIDPTHAEII